MNEGLTQDLRRRNKVSDPILVSVSLLPVLTDTSNQWEERTISHDRMHFGSCWTFSVWKKPNDKSTNSSTDSDHSKPTSSDALWVFVSLCGPRKTTLCSEPNLNQTSLEWPLTRWMQQTRAEPNQTFQNHFKIRLNQLKVLDQTSLGWAVTRAVTVFAILQYHGNRHRRRVHAFCFSSSSVHVWSFFWSPRVEPTSGKTLLSSRSLFTQPSNHSGGGGGTNSTRKPSKPGCLTWITGRSVDERLFFSLFCCSGARSLMRCLVDFEALELCGKWNVPF